MLLVLFVASVNTTNHKTESEAISLRHESKQAHDFTEILEKCKNVGGAWGSVTGVAGTWQGNTCDKKCTDNKGVVCGRVLKDCCALECQGSFVK